LKKYFERLLNLALILEDKDLINFLSSKKKIFTSFFVYTNDDYLMNLIKKLDSDFNFKISKDFKKDKKYDIGIFRVENEEDLRDLKKFLDTYHENFDKIVIYSQLSGNLFNLKKIKYLSFNKKEELVNYFQKIKLKKLECQKKFFEDLEEKIGYKLKNIDFKLEKIQYKKKKLRNFILNLQNYYIKKVEDNLNTLKITLKNELNNFIDKLNPKEVLFKLNNILKKLEWKINHIKPIIYQKCNSIFDSKIIIDKIKENFKNFPKEVLKEIEYELSQDKTKFRKFFEKLSQQIYNFFKYKFENLRILFWLSIVFFLISIGFGISEYKSLMYIFGLLSSFIFILFLFSYLLFNFLLKRSFDFYLRKKIANLKGKLANYFFDFFERLYDKLIKDLNIKENELKIKKEYYENFLEILKDIKSDINSA